MIEPKAKKISRDYWSNQRVLVTGHNGFIGTWLSRSLLYLGANVHGYSLASCLTPNTFDSLNWPYSLTQELNDICEKELLEKAIQEFKPSVVVHLAAEAIVKRAHQSPIECYNTNVIGTANLLEAIRKQPSVSSVILFTTDKVYQNEETGRAFKETDRLGGNGIYDSSKACCELVIQAYKSSFIKDLPISTIRAGNVIGGGDWSPYRLIPDVIRHWQNNESLNLRMPEAVRPWQHVMEAVYATLLIAQQQHSNPIYADSWNIGPDHEGHCRVDELIEILLKHINSSGDAIKIKSKTAKDLPATHESRLLYLDTSKAKSGLGWKPQLNLADAISLTAKWYKAFLLDDSPDNLTQITDQQIVQILNPLTVDK